MIRCFTIVFYFNATATTEIYTYCHSFPSLRASDLIAVPGNEADGVLAALDYLIASNRKGFGDAVPAFDDGRLDAKDRHVVVIGGGDTAMDCVRTAVRQGAKSVKCLYRRDQIGREACRERGCQYVWI